MLYADIIGTGTKFSRIHQLKIECSVNEKTILNLKAMDQNKSRHNCDSQKVGLSLRRTQKHNKLLLAASSCGLLRNLFARGLPNGTCITSCLIFITHKHYTKGGFSLIQDATKKGQAAKILVLTYETS